MNKRIKTLIIFTAIILTSIASTFLVRAKTTISISPRSYNVACISGRKNGMEKNLKNYYHFKKRLREAGEKIPELNAITLMNKKKATYNQTVATQSGAQHINAKKIPTVTPVKGGEYTCFFRVKDSDIKCLNPNYVRSGGQKELEDQDFTLKKSINGGHLGTTKAGTTCYFHKSDTRYNTLRNQWNTAQSMHEIPGARAHVVTTVSDIKKVLQQPLPNE